MATKHVIDSDDLPWETVAQGERFKLRRRKLGDAAGGRDLGCSLCEVEPGKTAWPFHVHAVNEEAIFVLAGRAMLRLGDKRVPLTAGDYVALPADPELAHQVTNTGDKPFRYLAISTMRDPDVVHYPDSDKVGVLTGACDDVRFGFFKTDATVDYWDGEPVGEPVRKTFRERVEAKVEELKRTVEERFAADDGKDDETLERQIDDEIEQLKKKLKL